MRRAGAARLGAQVAQIVDLLIAKMRVGDDEADRVVVPAPERPGLDEAGGGEPVELLDVADVPLAAREQREVALARTGGASDRLVDHRVETDTIASERDAGQAGER